MDEDFEHPEVDEKFLLDESKVGQLIKLLDDVANANKLESEGKKDDSKKIDPNPEPPDDFCVLDRGVRMSISKSKYNKSMVPRIQSLDTFPFMQQVDMTYEQRVSARLERERTAQNFRALGNDEYRKANFERAIYYYTKAIDQINDSPVLYCSRGLCYIKLRNYKRAIMDLDYVLNKLDEKCLKAWLYRAAAYRRENDEANYETSLRMARQLNPKEKDTIEEFLSRMRTGL